MAIVLDMHCTKCGEIKSEAVGSGSPTPTICHSCKLDIADEERRLHFKDLDGLTIEERLRRVEEWIYDYKPPISPHDIKY